MDNAARLLGRSLPESSGWREHTERRNRVAAGRSDSERDFHTAFVDLRQLRARGLATGPSTGAEVIRLQQRSVSYP